MAILDSICENPARFTMTWRNAVVIVLCGLACSSTRSALAAQHATAADVEEGGRAFGNLCANCHGPDGNLIAGVDLGRGRFRQAYTDAALVGIIRNGIPGTPMPRSEVSDEQAARIVAYLRSAAAASAGAAPRGDAARGKALFHGKGACTKCHRVGPSGSRLGPDLTSIGRARRAAQLERSLLEPDADVDPANRSFRVVTKDGREVRGRLLNRDSFSVQLLDEQERLRSFQKSDIREAGLVASPMPSFRGVLDAGEVADLVGYLASLTGSSVP
jgi:putative heme-binding domain-containing protein